jgi:hypothetical protein
MDSRSAVYYPHKRNEDGSFNSICLVCFRTVASNMTEDELVQEEKKHVCETSLLSTRGSKVEMVHRRHPCL